MSSTFLSGKLFHAMMTHMLFTFNPYASLCIWGTCVWIFLSLLSADNVCVCVEIFETTLGICYSFCLNDRRKMMHSVDDDDNNESSFLLMLVSKVGNVKLSVLRILWKGFLIFQPFFKVCKKKRDRFKRRRWTLRLLWCRGKKNVSSLCH